MQQNNFIGLAAILLSWIAIGCTSSGPLQDSKPTLEQHTFADLEKLMEQEQRPIAIFLHAPWCQFCKNMEQTTFQNANVIQLLNEKYYFLSFNGEQKESVVFNQQTFNFRPTGRNTGTHDLATALGTIDGALTYPSLIILNPAYEIVFQHNAFLSARSLRTILEKGSDD